MRIKDIWIPLICAGLFVPFVISDELFQAYIAFNAAHPLVMAFAKFGLLASLGEVIGYRIKAGHYPGKSFGLVPRMLVWGFLGVTIAIAFKIFAQGAPAALSWLTGLETGLPTKGGVNAGHVLTAFSISVAMNLSFAPVMMTLHRITDSHIESYKGAAVCLVRPVKFASILKSMNWDVQWNFVFKKTIPFFWIPAHTITFLLPGHFQVLFAALLGIVLGVILSVASVMGGGK